MKLSKFRSSLLFLFCSFLLVLSSCSYYHINAERVSAIEVNGDNEGDDEIARFIAPYSEKLNKAMDEVIGTAALRMEKKKPESLLGNFLADIVQHAVEENQGTTENLFSVVNYGGIRLDEIPEGDITRRSIYDLLPFENMIVIVEMNQAQLVQFLDHISARGPWPISNALFYKIRSADASAQNIKIHKKPINKSGSYYVAMPDYIANGGDDCSFLKELPRESTGLLLRDAVIDYIMKSDTPCSATIEGRISYE